MANCELVCWLVGKIRIAPRRRDVVVPVRWLAGELQSRLESTLVAALISREAIAIIGLFAVAGGMEATRWPSGHLS